MNEDTSTETEESAMATLLKDVDVEDLGKTVAGVLEFLSVRAYHDGPYYILNEDASAITVIGTNEDTKMILEALPDSVRSWDELQEEVADFLTDRDPGDEQPDDSE